MPRPIRNQPEILIDLFVFFSSFRCSRNRENLAKTMEGRSNSHFREYSLWVACEAFGAQFLNYLWVIFWIVFATEPLLKTILNFLKFSHWNFNDFGAILAPEMVPGRGPKVPHFASRVPKSTKIANMTPKLRKTHQKSSPNQKNTRKL